MEEYRELLIIARFQYFEQLADVQMLAMLSCVLGESSAANQSRAIVDRHSESQNCRNPTNWPSPETSGSSDYFPTFEVAKNLLRPSPPRRSDLEKRTSGPHSTSSSVGGTTSDPLTPYSIGATPPKILRPTATSFERHDSQMATTSAPPEHQRNTYRSSSNLASSFAASFSRPFSFNASISSSPPTTYLKKRLSPAGSYTGLPSTTVNWGATNVFAKQSTITEDPKSVYSLSVSDTEEDIAVSKPLVFTTKLKNQDRFDKEGYANVPLLDSDQTWRYQAYRASYAHMLLIWGLPLAQCEILKYNGHSSVLGLPTKSVTDHSPTVFAIGRSTTESSDADEENGLRLDFQIVRTAVSSKNLQRHDDPRLENSASLNSPLTCLLCAEIIRGLCSPCLACGHVLHALCRSIISSQTFQATESAECISGCGCRCANHATVEVGLPLQHQFIRTPPVIRNMLNEQEQHRRLGEDGNDGDVWKDIPREAVAYESLARVRERYITPRPSQIWRGG